MKTASILSLTVVSLCLTPAVFAQRTLGNSEVQDILKQLTSQPRTTWISAGTIQATHQEYGAAKVTDPAVIKTETDNAIRRYQQDTGKKNLPEELQKLEFDAIPVNVEYRLSNEYAMTSTVVVKYDGQRFYWETNLTSRSDSVPLDSGLLENYMVDHFKVHKKWNERTIASWDGQKYTTYSVSGGQALVDTAGKLGTPTVTGPLTAGLIPWGTGKFTYGALTAAKISASEISINGAKSIQMTIMHTDGVSTELVLDPSKAYAVTSATITGTNGLVVTYMCSGYKSYAGAWVPSSVDIDRANLPLESKMPTSEQWTFTSVSTSMPSLSSFSTTPAMDSIVEYISPATASSAIYINSYEADTDELLAQRLAYGAAEGRQRQNCATAALQHAASGFGKSASNAALANLVDSNGRTSLQDMKQFAQSLGLFSRIVKTDVAGLKELGTTKAILYLPGKKHFVVVDRVDDRYVWLVDLSSKKFYYRESVYFFPMAWSGGTALLVSDRPIPARFSEATADNITGGYWDCNFRYQEDDWVGCMYLSGLCYGTYQYYPERWICTVVSSGICNTSSMVRMQEMICYTDPIYYCMVNGQWIFHWMRACK